ncbi:MAG: hypothetical protein ABUS79_28710, partial [Pseudomonadota bacterium]
IAAPPRARAVRWPTTRSPRAHRRGMLRVWSIAPGRTHAPTWSRTPADSTRRPCAGWRSSRSPRAALWALALLVVARTVAAAPTVHVQAQDCPGIDAAEVERLLEIDLGPLAAPRASVRPVQVALACQGARLRMTARDPILDRQLVRDVGIGANEPGRDRTIALLVSQLFLTAWAEEFLEHPGPAPAANAAPAPPTRPPVPAGPRWELEADAGMRLRDWSAPALAERFGVAVSRGAGPVRLMATAGFERGAADRVSGAAVWMMGQLGAGAGWRSGRRGRVAFAAALTGAVVFTEIHGDPSSEAAAGSSVRGVLGEAALAAGPRLVWDRLRIGADLQIGVTFPGATARVSGDRDLALGGPWAGAALTVGWGAR